MRAACGRCCSELRELLNLDCRPSRAGRWARTSPTPEVIDDDVIRPLDKPVSRNGRHVCPARQPGS